MKKEIDRIMKISLLFFSLFIINILVLKILMILGFHLNPDSFGYLFPPLFSTVILLLLEKKRRLKARNSQTPVK